MLDSRSKAHQRYLEHILKVISLENKNCSVLFMALTVAHVFPPPFRSSPSVRSTSPSLYPPHFLVSSSLSHFSLSSSVHRSSAKSNSVSSPIFCPFPSRTNCNDRRNRRRTARGARRMGEEEEEKFTHNKRLVAFFLLLP